MVKMLFLQSALFLASLHGIQTLKICSFNVRSFGKSKVAKEGILDVLVKVISRCDLMLMMEIKDSRNKAFPMLMERLNNQGNGNEYEFVISKRLGRKAYKEQYAFIYRPKLLTVKRIYQYPDHHGDIFAREPYVVWFSSRYTTVRDFVIIPQHTAPDSAVRELNGLYDVYVEMKQRWRAKYFILMGDFNADCEYVRRKEWPSIRLRNDTNFIWLIGDNDDTTVKHSTHCAYDRIVLRGEKLVNAVIPNSANIFNFKEAYGMTERQALNVSDHFPVEVDLRRSRSIFYFLRSLAGPKEATFLITMNGMRFWPSNRTSHCGHQQ
ncbi:deoxyribonuclease gamma-like isoform X1 [Hemiscyllium ocellatum]|uniref:deoxyribonuclease gamma-like isoform X1 n=1 Tax=Hemiscyllium ocellatum TaxID=170820 RepID=UPI0029662D67|nr:deoxyribonuclease gamma-like isoform X1 [Hemiscyllium ocellatum]